MLRKILLFLLILIIITPCFASKKLAGGSYKIIRQSCNQGGSVIRKLTGGRFIVGVGLGSVLGNTYLSNEFFSVNPFNVASKGLSGRTAALTLTDAHAYPNPFKSIYGHNNITFTRLTALAEIRIFTIAGEEVCRLYKDDIMTDEYVWDVRNDDGERVFSDVYIYFIKSNNEIKTGKLMIIR